jgi:4-hydroxybenzoate polyprenyltransferase
MTGRTWLKLGRVSNLPTVITNTLVGLALIGAAPQPSWLLVIVAMLLFYTGGMFLNDAFDHRFDAEFAKTRPIPSGEATVHEVYVGGFVQLACGLLLLVVSAWLSAPAHVFATSLGGVILCGLIVLYDAWHKQNPLSPAVMGACRVMVVLSAALAAKGGVMPPVWWAAASLFAHLIGLTYAAKQEHLRTSSHWWPLLLLLAPLVWGASFAIRDLSVLPYLLLIAVADVVALRRLFRRAPGDVPAAVALFIAAISFVDALSLAAYGYAELALVCSLGFVSTLWLQRWVKGT